MRNRKGAVIAATLLAAGAQAAAAQMPVVATSPDRHTIIAIDRDAQGALVYTVKHDGRDVIAPSPVGLTLMTDRPDLSEAGRLRDGLTIDRVERRQGVDAYAPVHGKTSSVREPYAEVTVHAHEQAGAGRRIDLIARAYDGGVAFRLVLPQQPGLATVRIMHELTRFAFAGDYACTGLNLGAYHNSHEGEFDPIAAHLIRAHDRYDLPLVCRTGAGDTTFALTESDLDHYAGAYLSGRGEGGLGVEINLTPQPQDENIAVDTPMTQAGVATPWRVVLIADRAEKLVESNLVDALAAPSRIADTTWIKPGKAAWDWWSGPYLPGATNVGHNDATYRTFIDFAGRMGLPYMLIDEGWAKGAGGAGFVRPDSDVTKTAPGVDLPGLVAYAHQRGVGLWLWANWQALDAQMDAALPLYEKLGIKGIKIDFMDREDQAMVDFYHRLLAKAAAHHLMVDLHGAYVPRGLERTYPNFMTQEGVMGAEYNKWSARVTATHNVSLAYTRGLLGPMDYTPGGFRNVTPAAFGMHNEAPQVMTSRPQQLAMYVVYTSPFACLADSPAAYETANSALAPGADFLKVVPTSWDETRAIAGEFGHYIVVARRKGRQWFVGAMNDETARHVDLPLDVLGKGRWQVARWTDGGAPDTVRTDTTTVGSTALSLDLASGGGAALILTPAGS
ncbi:glycoside hydrolase family 97 protein [Sphingomonas nostoxanthinifaciens]|uniref:glycoside hydrolase family 97 protein n=1 Tax=Sphingomonas nostoxanthinifaciens TaxID=2872652 RepID=UPI001CC1E7A4|nr:glycoside hydrolase family 97 protein [Sphingomonas nostoxanthinifaciens]UAK23282.1 glycoside hydrolase family 97 protein [Sphingomonas nostoxanthinifaciens]